MKLIGVVLVIWGFSRIGTSGSGVVTTILIVLGAICLLSKKDPDTKKKEGVYRGPKRDIKIRNGGDYSDTLSDCEYAAIELERVHKGPSRAFFYILASSDFNVREVRFSFSVDSEQEMDKLLSGVNLCNGLVRDSGTSLTFKTTSVSGFANEQKLRDWENGINMTIRASFPTAEKQFASLYHLQDGGMRCNVMMEMY